MQNHESTVLINSRASQGNASLVTVFDGSVAPRTYRLADFRKNAIYFGRSPQNDIVLSSSLVSSQHGRFVFNGSFWQVEDKAVYHAQGSTNGLIYNHTRILSRRVSDGDFVRIDSGVETVTKGVLFVFSSAAGNKWYNLPLTGKARITIGRDSRNDVVLPHVSVSKRHASILFENGKYYISDDGSTNGVIVNNRRIQGKQPLHEKDVIAITNSKLIFTSTTLFFSSYRSGISVDADHIVVTRKKDGKQIVTTDNVSLNISPGELVAIVGGSGAGKSTVLNAMCGYLPPDSGRVYINGLDLYQNFDSLKKIVGYVPQSDIVYDNLSLYDMLSYTAKLRLPEDTSPEEREAAIMRAIDLVELRDEKNSFIKRLSGGQRKRASIAVELLSDPNLLFLDEPASGLDPGTERNLMYSLRKMANNGKTIILVTHSTLQLKMCDKIVFMGKGGRLCFYGSYAEAQAFFGVNDVVDVYNMITEQPKLWQARYNQSKVHSENTQSQKLPARKAKKSRLKQLFVLNNRYFKLVSNDRQRLMLLLLQAPLLALLIALVADGNQFDQYEMTKSLLFALTCSAFWVGMLNAIQEICKERSITKREYMTGLSLSSYICSKIIVLGAMCFIQSVMIVGVFSLLVGLPDKGVMMAPFFEILISTFITALASTAMGLFVSSLFTNADRAMTVAPILLMPQILFSGLLFKLSGVTEVISWFAICRWGMESIGSSADLNELPLRLQQEGIMLPHEFESFYECTDSHLLTTWLILIGFTVAFLVLARLVLGRLGKEKA